MNRTFSSLNSNVLADDLRNAGLGYTSRESNVKAPSTGSRRCYFGLGKAETLPKLIGSKRFGCAAHAARAALLQKHVSTIETNVPSVIYVRPNGQAIAVSDDILFAIAAQKISSSGPSGAPALLRGLS